MIAVVPAPTPSDTRTPARLAARIAAAWLVATLATGCATLLAPPPSSVLPEDDCTRFFARLDAVVAAAGVADAQDTRVPGFAFVRVDRIAVAAKDTLPWPQWLQRAAALDGQARDAEIANLPPGALPIEGAADAAAARARSNDCRAALTQHVARDATLQATLRQRASVPDRYSTALRALGAYPLLRWPFFAGVRRWQDAHTAEVARWSAQAPPRLRFEPPADDALAPVFEIESQAAGTLAPFDRFGAPVWPAPDAARAHVDVQQPVVFRRDGMTFFGGRWLRQRSYTLWFPERPAAGRFDLLAGALDGVIVRLTLAPDDRVLLLDTIHACGCYHAFYPAPGIEARADAAQHQEWAFVPAPLPPLARGQRLAVRIASRTHHVSGVAAVVTAAAAVASSGAHAAYALQDENVLRALPLPGGGSRSLYAPDGLVRGSERGERWLFWPMGIASAGAMRQWGHHATAFVGRRHFDDPGLLESRFVASTTLPPPP